jgi:hypothetical protein
MGVYQKVDERRGKERSCARNRKGSKGAGNVDNRDGQTPQGKAGPGAMVLRKAMDMTLGPHWDQIEEVRRKTRAFLKNHGLPRELIDALTMVSSELVENGMKYGCFEDPKNGLTFNLNIVEKNVIMEVTHPTSASAAPHLRRLDKTIQWIRGFQDPFQAYLEKLKEVARRPITDGESGLGLVRIAYEGKSIIDFFVAEDNALNVSAIAGIEKGLWR